jgi:uncharacterized protein (DUF362 family)
MMMDRREFLKQVAGWTAGLSLTSPLVSVLPKTAAASSPPLLSLAEGSDIPALVSKVLSPLGGMGGFVRKGDRVVVKPNIGWDRTPEQGANTHPDVVKAVVRSALDAGAGQVLVFDRTVNEERRCYVNSGIKAAVESLGDRRAQCLFVDSRKFVPVRIARGKSIQEWEFYRDALEADAYINLPVAKQHGSSGLTLGLKNIMGVIGGSRGRIHFNLGQRIADLNLVLRPKLTLLDATRILLRNGPQGGDLKDVKTLNTLVASSDTVAVDAYATTFFGLKPEEVESTKAANQLGLGEMDLKKIKVVRT